MNRRLENKVAVVTGGSASIGLGAALPSTPETTDTFTRHELPIPGAYFAKTEKGRSAIVAVDESRKAVGKNQSTIPFSARIKN
jgi:hypothetical protein